MAEIENSSIDKANGGHGGGAIEPGRNKSSYYLSAAHNNIKSRCYNKKHPAYRRYGGAGVELWKQWHEIERFHNDVLAEIGERPPPHPTEGKYTLSRIDPEGSYCPGNIRWATQREQANNQRINVWVEHEGLRMTKSQWGRALGLRADAIGTRASYRHCSDLNALLYIIQRDKITFVSTQPGYIQIYKAGVAVGGPHTVYRNA